jgi:protein-S-isoprenylcysteine O-methyltransferase Ste14
MRRIMVMAYGICAYAAFLAAFLYLVGFLTGLAVPKSINSGTSSPLGVAVVVNLGLLAAFAVQHSIMARPWFKTWWTRFVPRPVERSTFVLATSVILAMLFWQWRPLPVVVWQVTNPVGQGLLICLFFSGIAVVLFSSFLIDHFDLFGLRQTYLYFRGREYRHPPFMVRSLYKHIRHPLMAGFLIAVWSSPMMTLGHLFFAAGITAYVFLGIALEERDLRRILGEDYERYRERTPMILPLPKKPEPSTQTYAS